MPRVSVITPVYNGSRYIANTIRSVLAQTFKDFEYIIIDDGSVDNSHEIVTSFKDPRITVLHNQTNCYLVAARNRAIAAATGDYIALLDHDDLWTADRLAIQVAFLDQNPDFGMVGGWSMLIDENDKPAARRRNYAYTPDEYKISLLIRNVWGNGTLICRRALLDEPPYTEEYQLCEDYNFIYRLSLKSKLTILQKVILKYRVYPTNTSSLHQGHMIEYGRKLKSSMLEFVQCSMNEGELNTFNNIEHYTLPISFDLLDHTELCLQKLLFAVKKAGYVPDNAANSIVAEEWLIFCQRSATLGPGVWKKYQSSNLPKNTYGQTRRKLSLYLKSQFRLLRT